MMIFMEKNKHLIKKNHIIYAEILKILFYFEKFHSVCGIGGPIN
jgi:hypothetical protein